MNRLNIWNRHDFKNSRESTPCIGEIKHFFLCLKYSWQRITKGFADPDLWNIDIYLTRLLPDILEEFSESSHGAPDMSKLDTKEDGSVINQNEQEKEWRHILKQMVSFWREADEETCSRKNCYEEEYTKAMDEYYRDHDYFKEKQTCIADDPRFEDISKNYIQEEWNIWKYRKESREKAMDMLKQYFEQLWD